MHAYRRAQQVELEQFLDFESEEEFLQVDLDDGVLYNSRFPPCPSCGDAGRSDSVDGVVIHCYECEFHVSLTLDYLQSLSQVERNQVMFVHLLGAWSPPSLEGNGIGPYLV